MFSLAYDGVSLLTVVALVLIHGRVCDARTQWYADNDVLAYHIYLLENFGFVLFVAVMLQFLFGLSFGFYAHFGFADVERVRHFPAVSWHWFLQLPFLIGGAILLGNETRRVARKLRVFTR